MATFQYIATSNGSNKIIKGEIEALGRDDAIKSITKQQLTPISIKPATKLSNEIKFSLLKPRNVKQDELSIFTRQLSTMINAGVPLTRSLNSLQEHTENPVFRDTLDSIKGDVESGVSLADALGKHPKVFSDIYVNMVRAGEAAGILDDTENHILALTHIVDRIPAIVAKLTTELPEQLEDLESGYRKLLDANYHFVETDIESRLQLLYEALKNNHENLRKLELDNAEYENAQIQEEINALYDIFTREIAAQKVVEGLVATLPTYLQHMKDSNTVLVDDIQRLSQNYLLSEIDVSHVHRLQAELDSLEESVLELTSEQEEHSEPYSLLEERLENLQATLKEIEDEQVELSQRLAQIEKDDINARQKANVYVNRLHTIKRYMEKRNLPGIPQTFLKLFFTASNNTEDLMAELEQKLVNIESVNRILEIATKDMEELEAETYNIVQYATLTEQLLQYSNRYRSFDERIQEAFNESLEIFEKEFDYHASFDKISQALEVAEPGVTNRFVTSYEKTRETIRF